MESKRDFNVIEEEMEHFNTKVLIVDENDEIQSVDDYKEDELFYCGIDGCDAAFTSEIEYEKHYEVFHHYTCSFCNKRLLSDFLLTLHVLEEHDHLFKIMSQRQPMYQCFVKSCGERLMTKEERKAHIVSVHGIPITSPLFDFEAEKSNQATVEHVIIMINM